MQVSDCRFRPLTALSDDYRPLGRRDDEPGYYISADAGWTDEKVHDFRRRVREHNIWVRYARDRGQAYDRRMERWSAIHNTFKFFHLQRPPKMETIDGSATWRKRVELLTRARTACEKARSRPDWGGLSYRAVDSALRMIMDDGRKPGQMPLFSRAADAERETHDK